MFLWVLLCHYILCPALGKSSLEYLPIACSLGIGKCTVWRLCFWVLCIAIWTSASGMIQFPNLGECADFCKYECSLISLLLLTFLLALCPSCSPFLDGKTIDYVCSWFNDLFTKIYRQEPQHSFVAQYSTFDPTFVGWLLSWYWGHSLDEIDVILLNQCIHNSFLIMDSPVIPNAALLSSGSHTYSSEIMQIKFSKATVQLFSMLPQRFGEMDTKVANPTMPGGNLDI